MTTFHTYIGKCCTEWLMAFGFPRGRCGLCGEPPEYLHEDELCSCRECRKPKP